MEIEVLLIRDLKESILKTNQLLYLFLSLLDVMAPVETKPTAYAIKMGWLIQRHAAAPGNIVNKKANHEDDTTREREN